MQEKSIPSKLEDRDFPQASSSLHGGGAMGSIVRNYPWAGTPIGPIESWSPTLTAIVDLMLNSPVPSAVYWGPELIMIYNDPYRDNLGPRHPEALGASAYEVWQEFLPRFGDRFEAILREGSSCIEESVSLTVEVEGKTFETFWNYTMSPIYEDGKVAGIFKTNQNVTESVSTMNALVESDERLRMALSAGDCLAVWDWDLARDSVVVEGRYLDIRREVQGMPFSSMMLMVHPDDHADIYDTIADCIETGQDYQNEYRMLHPDGSTRWAMSKGRCIYGNDGEPIRVIGVTFDISGQKPGTPAADPQKPVTAEEFLQGASALIQPTSVYTPVLLERDLDDKVEGVSHTSRLALTIPKMVVSLIKKLVTDKDAVDLRTSGDCDSTRLLLSISPEDFHKMFLGDGVTFKAIRTLIEAASRKLSHQFTLEIADSHGNVLPSKIETIH